MNKFVAWGLGGNTWLWFHLLAGAVGGRIGRQIGLEFWITVGIVACLAGLWECFEYWWEGGRLEQTYHTWLRWKYDTAGDILGAVAMAAIAA